MYRLFCMSCSPRSEPLPAHVLSTWWRGCASASARSAATCPAASSALDGWIDGGASRRCCGARRPRAARVAQDAWPCAKRATLKKVAEKQTAFLSSAAGLQGRWNSCLQPLCRQVRPLCRLSPVPKHALLSARRLVPAGRLHRSSADLACARALCLQVNAFGFVAAALATARGRFSWPAMRRRDPFLVAM